MPRTVDAETTIARTQQPRTVQRVEPLLLFEPEPTPADPVISEGGIFDGAEVDTTVGEWGHATAVFDQTRRYRYRLSRVWDPAKPRLNFCMLNPSTADAFTLDPTVRRCIGYAQAWGYGALEVTNIFALRSTDPKKLYEEPDPVGPENNNAIVAAAHAADLVIAAWGVHGEHQQRGEQVRRLLNDAGIEVHYLKLTRAGHPGHPLYLPADTRPQIWRP